MNETMTACSYVETFGFPDADRETGFIRGVKQTCYDSFFPFKALSAHGVKIYDLDDGPVDVKRWTELGNVRAYYDFFRKHEGEFQRDDV